MSYQTIASKYRSQTFEDLVGQESVSLALMGSITQGRIPAGIIFSGTRGVGKTSLARIYAKALNCEAKKGASPCGSCYSCQAIAQGNHEDVVEIDGASNNGVDEVRALKESTVYVPQRSRYRIYIIDEVHMLSVSAFNALLKTLEEPPAHVVFLFATTELAKLPQTVVSRCQTFHLRKISVQDIAERIAFILKAEEVTWEDGLLPLLAREGRGSMRDALTFLDQLIAMAGSHLTRAALEKIVGSLSQEVYLSFLEFLLDKNGAACLKLIEEFDAQALSFVKVASRLATLTRHAFVLKAMGPSQERQNSWDLEENEWERLEALARGASPLALNQIFRFLASCLEDLRESTLDRYIFENNCLEWCLAEGSHSVQVSQSKKETSSPALHSKPVSLAQDLKQEAQVSSNASSKSISLAQDFKKELKKEEQTPVVSSQEDKKEVAPPPSIPSSTEEEVEERKVEHDSSFPPSWKDLVARWKQIKPLQARKLEEIIPHTYSPKQIILLVDETSLVGPTFLREDTRKKVAIVLAKLFNFKGELIVKPKSFVGGQQGELSSEKSEALPQGESLLDEKQRHKSQKEQEATEFLEQHELTKGLCEKFNGRITETFIDV